MSSIPRRRRGSSAGVRYELDGRSSYTFAEDVSSELISRITDGHYEGVTIKTAAARVYNTKLAAHILGTVGAIWQEEWRSDEKDRLCGLRGSGLLHERSGGQGRRGEGL